MTTSQKPSLDNLQRADLQRLVDKYYKTDRNFLRDCLWTIFKKPENIHLFGWFVARRYFPLETPQFHRDILALASDKSNRRVGIVAPRGHAKSTTLDFLYPMWSACYKQHEFAVIISDTYTQAEEFVNALRDEFENNVVLKWLFGNLVSDEWKSGEFVLKNGVKFVAKGSSQKIRGIRHRHTRPDLMIFDDIENDENIQSAEQRSKLYRWFNNAALQALSRDGRAILIGTILHYDSLVNKVVKQDDIFKSWLTRIFYAIEQDAEGNACALWPEHRSLEKLYAIREDPSDPDFVGSITFAQEYMHKPFSEEDALVRPDWIQEIEPGMVPNSTHRMARVMTVDPAASEKQSADPTARIVADLFSNGNVYVRAVGNDRTSPSVTAENIKDWYATYDPDRVGVEEGALGLVFKDLLAGLPVMGLKPDKDKVRRLLAVSRFFEAGRVFIVKGIKNGQALREQLVEFPKGSHDDMVDALVYALRMLLIDGMIEDEEAVVAGDYEATATPKDNDDALPAEVGEYDDY